MLNITTMPKAVLGELIAYLADHATFRSIENSFAGEITVQEVRAAFRELAIELKREAASESACVEELICTKTMSKKAKEVLSCLSTYEEKKLLSAFSLIEES